MGQNMFSRHLSKVPYSQKSESIYESKHHKENFVQNGKTAHVISPVEDVPPNKKRRVFPESEPPVRRESLVSYQHIPSPAISSAEKKKLRLRKSVGADSSRAFIKSNGLETPTTNGVVTKSSSEKRTPRLIAIKSIGKKLPIQAKRSGDSNRNFHELRSSKKCQWMKDGLWTAPANVFYPPSCPDRSTHYEQSSYSATVEVPSFRRNPIKAVNGVKSSQHAIRMNSLSPKQNGRRASVLFEDISDDTYNRRHRKSEDLEKRIVRWDRQRQRELEYCEYLRQREAQRKNAKFVPRLTHHGSTSSTPSTTSCAKPSTSQANSVCLPAFNADRLDGGDISTLWPSVENIQFIEILPANKSLVNVTFLGRPLPAIDKAAFSLPWPVKPQNITVKSSPSKSPKSPSPSSRACTSRRKEKTVSLSTTQMTVRKKVKAARAKILGASKRTSTILQASTRQGAIKRSRSLPGNTSTAKKSDSSTLMTRHREYTKALLSPVSRVTRRMSVPSRTSSRRLR